MLALAALACDVPDEIDDAPVFAAIRTLLDGYELVRAAEPAEPRHALAAAPGRRGRDDPGRTASVRGG